MLKAVSTRDIIRTLEKYEKENGVGYLTSICTAYSDTEDVAYTFAIKDECGIESSVVMVANHEPVIEYLSALKEIDGMKRIIEKLNI